MANNYTTSSPTTLEQQGDSVANSTLPSSAAIIVTPNTGFVIQASDFSIGSTLPIEVTSVSFSDSVGALDPLAFTGINNVISGQTADFTIAGTSSTLTSTTASLVKTNTINQDIPCNSKALVAYFVIDASVLEEGYYAPPTFTIISNDISKWSSQLVSVLYGTSSTDTTASSSTGQITYYKIGFYYEMGNTAIPLSAGESIIVKVPQAQTFRTEVISINTASYDGYKNQDVLKAREENLSLTVSGAPSATYDITVMDDIGQTYDFVSETFTRPLTKSSEQTINLGDPTITTYSNSHVIKLLHYFEKTSYNRQLTTTVSPTGTTKTSADGTSVSPFVIVLNQFGEVDFTVQTIAADKGVSTTTSVKTLSNQIPLSYPTIFNPTDFPELSTNNNGYFNISTALSYSVTDNVDGGFSGTTMNVDVASVTKKVEVGDTVTGTNIAANTKVEQKDYEEVTTRYLLDKTPTSTVTDGTEITFTRTVGISRQPEITDFDKTNAVAMTGCFGVYTTYAVAQATSSSNIVNIYDLDGEDISGISVGMTVQGDSISGYPTVLSQNGGSLVLSSNQSFSVGDTLEFSPVMSNMGLITASGSEPGRGTCKLNLEGYISRMGYENVVAGLTLQNFITAYVTPVATATTATCALGGSVKIEPLAVCVGHTGTLTISSITAGAYKVNDGIIESEAAANITITLTQ